MPRADATRIGTRADSCSSGAQQLTLNRNLTVRLPPTPGSLRKWGSVLVAFDAVLVAPKCQHPFVGRVARACWLADDLYLFLNSCGDGVEDVCGASFPTGT